MFSFSFCQLNPHCLMEGHLVNSCSYLTLSHVNFSNCIHGITPWSSSWLACCYSSWLDSTREEIIIIVIIIFIIILIITIIIILKIVFKSFWTRCVWNRSRRIRICFNNKCLLSYEKCFLY